MNQPTNPTTNDRGEKDNEWISVRLSSPTPNLRVRAIITYGNGRMEEIHTQWVERTDCFDHLLCDNITHWQYIHLPTHPHVEQTEQQPENIAIEFADWLNNNWLIPADDGFWKLDVNQEEYQNSLKIDDEETFYSTEELFELFTQTKP